jgi:hypothetical protein
MRKGYSRLADLRERRAVYETVLNDSAEKLPHASALSDAVHRRLAREALADAGRAYLAGGEQRAHATELASFALECWPGAGELSLYRTIDAHRRIGPRGASFMLLQKAQWWLRRRSWHYRGV